MSQNEKKIKEIIKIAFNFLVKFKIEYNIDIHELSKYSFNRTC